jgi:hypothetical protein
MGSPAEDVRCTAGASGNHCQHRTAPSIKHQLLLLLLLPPLG